MGDSYDDYCDMIDSDFGKRDEPWCPNCGGRGSVVSQEGEDVGCPACIYGNEDPPNDGEEQG